MKHIIFFILLAFTSNALKAQACLYAENIQDNVVVTDAITGEMTSYTLMRDHVDKNQWYYEPKRLRLSEKIVEGNKPEPKISIVKYQYTDKVTNTNKEGGMIFASFTFSARPTEEQQMREILIERIKNPKARIGCMRYKSSNYMVLPLAKEFLIDGFAFNTEKGAINNAEMAVAIPFTGLGVSVIAESGFVVQNNLVFTGMMPPCNLHIKGNWDNIYKYEEKQLAAGVSLNFWKIHLGGTTRKNSIQEEMKETGVLEITDTNCEDKVSDTRFAAVIKSITDEVYTNNNVTTNTERITALQEALKDPNITKAVSDKIKDAIEKQTSGLTAGANHVNIKSSQRKRGSFQFDYNKYTSCDRETTVSGLLNLREYNLTEEELKKYILEVNYADGFPEAVFGLPPSFDESLKIRSARISVSIPPEYLSLSKDLENVKGKTAQWSPETGWTMNGQKIASLPFSLLGVDKKVIEKLDFFQTELSIQSDFPNNTFKIKKNVKAFNGTENFDAIEQLVNTITVDASSIDFAKLTANTSDIDYISVKIKYNGKTYSRDIKHLWVNGSPQPPNLITFLMPKNELNNSSPIEVEILFYRGDQREPIIWQNNGNFDGSEITLRNIDWKE